MGSLPVYCIDFNSLLPFEQDIRKKAVPLRCPKGPVNDEVVQRSGLSEEIRCAIDRITRSLNRSLNRTLGKVDQVITPLNHLLELVHRGKIDPTNVKFRSAGGCQTCYEAPELILMLTAAKWDKLQWLVAIKDNCRRAFLKGEDVPELEEQQKLAKYLVDHVNAETVLREHHIRDPLVDFTLPLLLLSRSAAQNETADGAMDANLSVKESEEENADGAAE
ncbi:MAG: hypothetical protein Q9209_005700 [Squamulea sp. 1 TL-2023]